MEGDFLSARNIKARAKESIVQGRNVLTAMRDVTSMGMDDLGSNLAMRQDTGIDSITLFGSCAVCAFSGL